MTCMRRTGEKGYCSEGAVKNQLTGTLAAAACRRRWSCPCSRGIHPCGHRCPTARTDTACSTCRSTWGIGPSRWPWSTSPCICSHKMLPKPNQTKLSQFNYLYTRSNSSVLVIHANCFCLVDYLELPWWVGDEMRPRGEAEELRRSGWASWSLRLAYGGGGGFEWYVRSLVLAFIQRSRGVRCCVVWGGVGWGGVMWGMSSNGAMWGVLKLGFWAVIQ